MASASVSPDTITLSVNIESNCHLRRRYVQSIECIAIGAKQRALKLNAKDNEGVKWVDINDSKTCSLSELNCRKLGQIGLNVYSYYGHPLDIEWGISGDKIFLFQCRPVTTLDSDTEWELIHELDTGHIDETGCHTRANVGEVMPGVMSYLTLTSIIRQLGVGQSVGITLLCFLTLFVNKLM